MDPALAIRVPTFTTFILLERQPLCSDCVRMEPSVADYRKFAEECRRLAQFAKTAEERKILEELEAAWAKLLEQADGKGG